MHTTLKQVKSYTWRIFMSQVQQSEHNDEHNVLTQWIQFFLVVGSKFYSTGSSCATKW